MANELHRVHMVDLAPGSLDGFALESENLLLSAIEVMIDHIGNILFGANKILVGDILPRIRREFDDSSQGLKKWKWFCWGSRQTACHTACFFT